jgi:hypothetical protein
MPGCSPLIEATALESSSTRPTREDTVVLAFLFSTGRAQSVWTIVPVPSPFFPYMVLAEKCVPLCVVQSLATPNSVHLSLTDLNAPMASLTGAIPRIMRVLVVTEGDIMGTPTRMNIMTVLMVNPAMLAGTPKPIRPSR